MPHIPDSRHADHDAELVAAYAAGDAEGAALDAATAMVAGCPECAALHHDLRAIAAALPALAPPVRTRDFRLTPDQAASLRSSRWRRLLDTVAGPRFRLATPVGTGLAALGVAGLLLGSLAGTPLVPAGTGAAATAAGPEVAADAASAGRSAEAPALPPAAQAAVASAAPSSAAAAAPVVPSGGAVDPEHAVPDEGPGAGSGYASPGPNRALDAGSVQTPQASGRDTAAASADGDTKTMIGVDRQAIGGQPSDDRPLAAIGGAVALGLGLGLLGLRWASRRLA